MSYVYKQAFRGNIGLLIALAGYAGSGKTKSALRMATGMVGRDQKFLFIDTEGHRGLHYAPLQGDKPDFVKTFYFDYDTIEPPFRPQSYLDTIIRGDKAGYRVIVIDSFSHEWYGEDGVLEWQEKLLAERVERSMKRNPKQDEWSVRQAQLQGSWIEPKMAHKKMVQRLLQCKSHLIFCLRAEDKTELERDSSGKMKMVPKKSPIGRDGYIPICERRFPYELTCSILLTPEKPGIPYPIKIEDNHENFFPAGKLIDEECGRLFAEWAAGGKPEKPRKTPNPARSQDSATSGKEDEKKSTDKPVLSENKDKNGHISTLYPEDWEKVRIKVEKKLESAWKDLKEDTLGEFVSGRNENYRDFAINELCFRIVKFGELYAGAGQREDFDGTTGGDISAIPKQELAGVAKQLRSGWKRFTEKK